MKRFGSVCVVACVLVVGVFGSQKASAAGVVLGADSLHNAYGSPLFAAEKAANYAAISGGTFVNMAGGMYPGTTKSDPLDAIVYSTGDLGKRLHFFYWVADETTTSLNGRFEARLSYDWDGVNYVDFGWYQPTSWQNYTNASGVTGVIGTFGEAWWATDNEAAPLSTGGSLYDETNAADIAALRADVLNYQTYWLGEVRIKDDAGAWQTTALNVNVAAPVPLPAAFYSGLAFFLALAAGSTIRSRMRPAPQRVVH